MSVYDAKSEHRTCEYEAHHGRCIKIILNIYVRLRPKADIIKFSFND